LNCNGVTLRADDADNLLEETFLDQWGDSRVTRRVFVPGEDHSHELDQVNETIARLRRESDAGLVVSEDDERVYVQRMKTLIDRRTVLSEAPVRASGWITEETGQTYAEVWPDHPDRRQLLSDAGIRFVLKGEVNGQPVDFHLLVPEDRIPIKR
jgi:site-specific DNA recombinase